MMGTFFTLVTIYAMGYVCISWKPMPKTCLVRETDMKDDFRMIEMKMIIYMIVSLAHVTTNN